MQIIFDNTSIIPFKWRGRYVCFYCGKNYSDYAEFKKHTKSHSLCSTKDYSLRIINGSHIQVKLDISEIICEICYEQFKSFHAIVDHLICKHNMEYDKTVDVLFQEYSLVDTRCQFCDEVFSYFGYLFQHINNVHPLINFICDDCGAALNTKRDLTMHIRYFHSQGGYPCEECSEKFETYYLLKKHQNNLHFRKCKMCQSSFASYFLLQKHVKQEHPDDGSHRCPHCLKEFHSPQGLGQHIGRCKMKASVIASRSPEDNCIQLKKKQNILQIRQNIQCVLNMSTAMPFKFFYKYSCFYCSKKYVEFEELKEHTTAEHPVCDVKAKYMKNCKGERVNVKIDISSLSCKICFLPIEDFNDLIDHIIIKHKAPYDKTILGCLEPFKIIKDNIPCPFCPNVFRYFGILLRHINSEHSKNNRICDFCGKSFKNAVNLNLHIAIAHTGSCECEICGSKYKNQWCLGRHRAKCHDVKNYKCPKCPELFQSEYHRQKHLIKVHDIGHKCSYCNKMFTRNSFMKNHIRRTHLKEKNVSCSVCNERFFDNYSLKLHMVRHEGERRFCCDVCGKAFLRKKTLSTHMEMHKKYGYV